MSQSNRKRSSKSKRGSRAKAGDEYQAAIAQVAQSLDPAADVEVGVWVNGPDGRRDLDVVVRPKSPDFRSLVVIECKDWNRPIGIALIDALDSKRKDIGATAAMVCSNSGFTADALRKAARVGIPALAALKKGDKRIRVVVREQIYTRVIEYLHHSPHFHHPHLSEDAQQALKGPCHTTEWTFDGKSIEAWVASILLEVAAPATCSRSFVARYEFRRPAVFYFRHVPVEVVGIDIKAAFKVQWLTQVAEIDASQGMYDYLRKVVVFGPGTYEFHATLNSETWGEPVDINDVPPRLLVLSDAERVPSL